MKKATLKKFCGVSTFAALALTAGPSSSYMDVGVGAAKAPKPPNKKDFVITENFSEWQGRQSRVAMGGGKWVLVWVSESSAIMARRYDVITTLPEPDITISGTGTEPVVAMDAQGEFVVAWKGNLETCSPDPYQGEVCSDQILARRFDAAGSPKDATPILVSDGSAEPVEEPSVAMDADGDFVVAWNNSSALMARHFDYNGYPGTAVEVDTDSEDATVAMSSNGDFVVGWKNTYEDKIYVKRFDPAGTAKDELPITVAGYSNAKDDPCVAMDADGDFVVGWEKTDYVQVKQCYSYYGKKYCETYEAPVSAIYAKRFSAAGTAQGEEFQVSVKPKKATTSTQAFNPTVAMDQDGDFIVGWNVEQGKKVLVGKSCYSYYGHKYCEKYYDYRTYSDVYVQRFQKITGKKSKAATMVSSRAKVYETVPQVAMNPEGNFVVAWTKQDAISYYDDYSSYFYPTINAKFLAK